MVRIPYITVLLLILGILTGCVRPAPEPEGYRAGIKNVILIAVDTLAADNLHFMGYDRETSPFMDSLASQSVVFEQAYTPKALTLPSFATIFSGMTPNSSGVHDNGVIVPETLNLLTENFRSAGFRTTGFAAASVIGSQYGLSRGFDIWEDSEQYQLSAYDINQKVYANFADEQALEQPFFLFIHYFDPHTDYTPDPDYLRQFADMSYRGPVTGRIDIFNEFNARHLNFNDADLQMTRDLYDAEIRTFDSELKKLFDFLEHSGFMENSVVMLTADHGENLGEHHYTTHGYPYEVALHVPLLVHFPADLGAGRRVDGIVETTDIMPTLMDLMRIDIPSGLDGRSFLPMIEDETGGTPGRTFTLASDDLNPQDNRIYSIFDGQYRLLKYIDWSIDEPLLWDVGIDPHETNDLAVDMPEKVRLLDAALELMASGESLEVETEMDPETEAMLRSLGYIQ